MGILNDIIALLTVLALVIGLFCVGNAIAMFVVGALGHILNREVLQVLGFWDMALISIIVGWGARSA